MRYQTKYNQDIFYVINDSIGDLNQVYNFLISNQDFTLDQVPVNVSFDFTPSVTTPPIVQGSTTSKKVTQFFLSLNNQTIFDIALMTITDLNQVFSLLSDTGVNDLPGVGAKFSYNINNVTDNILKTQINNGLIFCTGQNAPETNYRISISGNRRISALGNNRIYK